MKEKVKINTAQPPKARGEKRWIKEPAERPVDRCREALVVYGD